MKTLKTLILCITVMMFTQTAKSTDRSYYKKMETAVADLSDISGIDSWNRKALVFEKISLESNEEWLPFYYQAYSYLHVGMEQKELAEADKYYDTALKILDHAELLEPANSEISTLKGWLLSMKITVDPMKRGYELGMQANQMISAAIIQDASNPRPYLLKAFAAIYTPEQYGGGKKLAEELLKESIQKQANFKPSSSIMPSWGLKKAQDTLAELQHANN